LAKKENIELDISMRFVNILEKRKLNSLMTTANENTTVSSTSFAADARSNQGDDGLIPEDEAQSVRDEVQSFNDGYRSSHAHDQPMLEIGNRVVRAHYQPMAGDGNRSMRNDENRPMLVNGSDRHISRLDVLPMIVDNKLLQIENCKAKKYFSLSERGVKGSVVTVNRLKHFAFIKR
jgi:hypothetical protein